jgi:hypothetical protein
MADTRRPIHLGVVVGISAGMYAISLAGVTGLQSIQDARTAADRAPAADAAARLDAVNSDLETRLDAARTAFDSAAAAYSAAGDRLAAYEGRLKELAGTVTKIQGSSITLPSGGLQRVSGAGSVAKPPVHTTTAASGKP